MANQYTKKKAAKTTPNPKMPLENLPPRFQLLAQDNFTTLVLGYWIQLAESSGVSVSKVAAARKRLAEIEEWRRLNPLNCKKPD